MQVNGEIWRGQIGNYPLTACTVSEKKQQSNQLIVRIEEGMLEV